MLIFFKCITKYIKLPTNKNTDNYIKICFIQRPFPFTCFNLPYNFTVPNVKTDPAKSFETINVRKILHY